jgi:hypothetical protein
MHESRKKRMSFSRAFAETRVLSLVMPTMCVSLGLAGWAIRAKFGASITELIVFLGLGLAILLVTLFVAIRRHQMGRNPFMIVTPSGDFDIHASRREMLASVPLTIAGVISIYFFIAGHLTHVLAALVAGIVLWRAMRRLLLR